MPQVKIIKDCSQPGRIFEKGPKPVEVSESEASLLIALGNAEAVAEPAAPAAAANGESNGTNQTPRRRTPAQSDH